MALVTSHRPSASTSHLSFLMEIRFCYQVLELSPGISQSELRQAYRDLVQVWHPDRFSHDPRLQAKAEGKLVQINEAYQTLGHLLEQRDRLQVKLEKSPSQRQKSPTEATPEPTQTTEAAPSTSSQPPPSASPSSAETSSRSSSRAPFQARNNRNAYRRNSYRRGFSIRWFFTMIAMSMGVILMLFAPFVIAYVIAEQPGLFLLPAVAMVGLYGYRVLKVG